MARTPYQQLEHEMQCAIETGNQPEIDLVVSHSESAYGAGEINAAELATLVWDSIVYKEAVC